MSSKALDLDYSQLDFASFVTFSCDQKTAYDHEESWLRRELLGMARDLGINSKGLNKFYLCKYIREKIKENDPIFQKKKKNVTFKYPMDWRFNDIYEYEAQIDLIIDFIENNRKLDEEIELADYEARLKEREAKLQQREEKLLWGKCASITEDKCDKTNCYWDGKICYPQKIKGEFGYLWDSEIAKEYRKFYKSATKK